MEMLKSEIPGARRIKIRSRPYNVSNMRGKSINGHAGMLENYVDTAIKKPCSKECVILRQVGGLEYPNGDNANIDTGIWYEQNPCCSNEVLKMCRLHRMLHLNTGPRRWDPIEYGRVCLPHVGIMSIPSASERYYVTRNERSRVD